MGGIEKQPREERIFSRLRHIDQLKEDVPSFSATNFAGFRAPDVFKMKRQGPGKLGNGLVESDSASVQAYVFGAPLQGSGERRAG